MSSDDDEHSSDEEVEEEDHSSNPTDDTSSDSESNGERTNNAPFSWLPDFSETLANLNLEPVTVPDIFTDPDMIDAISRPAIDPEIVDAITQPTFDPEMIDAITQPAIDPATIDDITQPAVDPEMIDAITHPAIDPATIDGITQPAVDPEMIDAITQSAIDPKLLDAISMPTIEPAVIDSLARPAIEPELINAIESVDLSQVLDAYEFAVAFDQMSQQSFDTQGHAPPANDPPEPGGFVSDFLNIIAFYLLNNPDILSDEAKDHARELLQTDNVQLKAQELADVVRSLGVAGHTALSMAASFGAKVTYIIHFSEVSFDEQNGED